MWIWNHKITIKTHVNSKSFILNNQQVEPFSRSLAQTCKLRFDPPACIYPKIQLRFLQVVISANRFDLGLTLELDPTQYHWNFNFHGWLSWLVMTIIFEKIKLILRNYLYHWKKKLPNALWKSHLFFILSLIVLCNRKLLGFIRYNKHYPHSHHIFK